MRVNRSKPVAVTSGVGELHFSGFTGPVDYHINGEPARLKVGIARLRGSFNASVETAEAAFRAGEGVLHLETGEHLRLSMLGHTAGAGQVFVELRV